MLVGNTFRMGGHATHDEREARALFSAETFAAWGRKDPVGLYEEHLKGLGVAASVLSGVEAQVEAEVTKAEEDAIHSRDTRVPDPATAVEGVYAR
jgi:TPP-dependent pyruvate/acetoin dehydrogenase alpha subunit